MGTFMNVEQSTGLKTSATKSEATRVTITVMGRYFMNSPMMPGQKTRGPKAQIVVSVEAITGAVTWLVPCSAASVRLMPMPRCRKMFSTTTIALSTSMPSARISEKSTTMFSVMPIARSTMKLSSIEKGIAEPTKSEFVQPRKRKSTATTRIRPLRMLFSSSRTMSRM